MTSPLTQEAVAQMPWHYEIKHGPDGEQNYAWVYEGSRMVAVMKTADAIKAATLAAENATMKDYNKRLLDENIAFFNDSAALRTSEAALMARVAGVEEALRDTLEFVERHSNRWDGANGKHPQIVVDAARAALSTGEKP